jgi:hypothetical protein
MEQEDALSCSQEPATGRCIQEDEFSPHPNTLFRLLSNNARPHFSTGVFLSGFPNKNSVCILQ